MLSAGILGGAQTVSGTASPGARVDVYTPNGTKTVTADQSGHWTVNFDEGLKAGDVTAWSMLNGNDWLGSDKVTVKHSNVKPTIIGTSNLTISVGDVFNPLTGVTANDSEDGDLTGIIKVTANNVDSSKAGIYQVTYSVSDKEGLVTTATRQVTVNNKKTGDWDFAIKYKKGEQVTYKGKVYEALVDFTTYGDPNWSPDIAVSLWKLVQ